MTQQSHCWLGIPLRKPLPTAPEIKMPWGGGLFSPRSFSLPRGDLRLRTGITVKPFPPSPSGVLTSLPHFPAPIFIHRVPLSVIEMAIVKRIPYAQHNAKVTDPQSRHSVLLTPLILLVIPIPSWNSPALFLFTCICLKVSFLQASGNHFCLANH